jgi:hypothetical protein
MASAVSVFEIAISHCPAASAISGAYRGEQVSRKTRTATSFTQSATLASMARTIPSSPPLSAAIIIGGKKLESPTSMPRKSISSVTLGNGSVPISAAMVINAHEHAGCR